MVLSLNVGGTVYGSSGAALGFMVSLTLDSEADESIPSAACSDTVFQ